MLTGGYVIYVMVRYVYKKKKNYMLHERNLIFRLNTPSHDKNYKIYCNL